MNPFDPRSALLAKHSQHVVFVHFPIALLLTGVVFDFAARWTKKATLAATARLNILAAAVFVLPTLATGIVAWQWQLASQKLKGLVLLHFALGCTSGLLYLSGCLDPFSASKNLSFYSSGLPLAAGTPDRRGRCSYRSHRRFSEWCQRS